jgi:hypothetical protein
MAEPARPALQSEGLRERHVTQAISEEASSSVSSEPATPQNESEVEKEKKTFGRTPDGTSTLLSIMEYENGAATTLCEYFFPTHLTVACSLHSASNSRYGLPITGSSTTQESFRRRSACYSLSACPYSIPTTKLPQAPRIRSSVLVLARMLQYWDRVPPPHTIESSTTGSVGQEVEFIRKSKHRKEPTAVAVQSSEERIGD